jgi:tRNA pseudouridine55 synthase
MHQIRNSGPKGFLNVSKPYGWTSHDVVQLVRKLTGVRRVGHGGTLDPAAAGVLLVAVGRATRLLDYLANQDKSYCGDIVLGATTDTDDAEGTVISVRDPSGIGLRELTSALSRFIGEIQQVPPQYSAVKLRGQKAYEVARRGGALELAPRTISIHGVALLAWEPPTLSVLVRCSKGTYIRSLARDVGDALGVGAHMGALVRLTSGGFTLADSSTIEDLRLASEFGYLDRLMWSPDTAVRDLPTLIVPAETARDMVGGRQWNAVAHESGDRARVYSESGAFLGIAECLSGNWQPRIVMSEED